MIVPACPERHWTPRLPAPAELSAADPDCQFAPIAGVIAADPGAAEASGSAGIAVGVLVLAACVALLLAAPWLRRLLRTRPAWQRGVARPLGEHAQPHVAAPPEPALAPLRWPLSGLAASGAGLAAPAVGLASTAGPAAVAPRPPVEDNTDLAWMRGSVAVIDLETTGLDASKHQIIEVAAIVVLPGPTGALPQRHMSELIKPLSGTRITSTITRITGIDRALLMREGADHDAVLRRFFAFIGELPVVAYNAEFDARFLQAAAQRLGLRFDNELHCALKVARAGLPGLASYKLVEVIKGLPGGQERSHGPAHRAMADAGMALVVYVAVGTLLHWRRQWPPPGAITPRRRG